MTNDREDTSKEETTQLTNEELSELAGAKGSSGSSDPTDLNGGVELNSEGIVDLGLDR